MCGVPNPSEASGTIVKKAFAFLIVNRISGTERASEQSHNG